MADRTKIEWTDATWNPIVGCKVTTPGCTNCYAMKLAGGRMRNHPTRRGLTVETRGGPVWNGDVRFNEAELLKPLSWSRPRRIFGIAHGDLFYEGVPTEWVDKVFAVAALSPRHTLQLLTKRVDRMRAYLTDRRTPRRIARSCVDLAIDGKVGFSDDWPVLSIGPVDDPDDITLQRWPLPNVWLGASVEDQPRADQRREDLRAIAAAAHLTWVSYEPALGPVDWAGWEFIKWLVSGGESGGDARPTNPDWHRAARDFCGAWFIAFLFKQWGEYRPTSDAGGPYMMHVGKKAAGRQLDGVTWDQYPGDLG